MGKSIKDTSAPSQIFTCSGIGYVEINGMEKIIPLILVKIITKIMMLAGDKSVSKLGCKLFSPFT